MTRDIEPLLAQTQWLGRLATELVPAADREDLIQDVMLAAIQRGEQPRHLRGWLATVARNLASRRRHRHRHRVERERDVALHAGLERNREPDPAAAVEAFSSHQAVVNAVMALNEQYRTALLLRFWQDLPAREVARRTNVPVETARTRIKRGVDTVRRSLDRDAGGRLAWTGGLLQINAVREALLVSATSASSAAGTATLTTLTGTLAMKKATVGILSAVAVATTAILYTLWGPSASTALSDGRGEAFVAADASLPRDQGPAAQRAGPDVRRAADTTRTEDRAAGLGSLEVRVAYPDSSPARSVGVFLGPIAGPTLGEQIATADDGISRFEGLTPGDYRLLLDRGGGPSTLPIKAGHTTHDVVIPRGVAVRGRVVTMDRVGVADAVVYSFQPAHPDAMVPLARTDARGTFVAHDLVPDTVLCARADGWQPSLINPKVSGPPGTTDELEIRLGARGHSLTGSIVDGDGRPVPLAWIGVAVDEDCRKHIEGMKQLRAVDGDAMLDREWFCIRADGDGKFASTEIPWGHTVLAARGHGPQDHLVGVAAQVVERGADNEITVRLQPGARVSGTVRDTAGQPYVGVPLQAALHGSVLLGEMARGYGEHLANRRTTSAADGSFELSGLLAAEYDLDRGALGDKRIQRFTVVEGQHLRLDLSIERTWDLEVRVEDPAGTPLKDWCLSVVAADDGDRNAFGRFDGRSIRAAHTGAEGTYVVRGLDAPRYVVSVHGRDPATGQPLRLPSLVRTVRPMDGSVVAVVEPELCAIRGRILDPTGDPADGAEVQVHVEGFSDFETARVDRDGNLAMDHLPGGKRTLVLSDRGLPTFRREVALVAGQTLDLGDVRWPEGIEVEIELQAVDGSPLAIDAAPELRLTPLETEVGRPSQRTGPELRRVGDTNVWRSTPVAAGTYRLSGSGEGIAAFTRDVTLVAGGTSRHVVRCPGGVSQAFALTVPPPSSGRSGAMFFAVTISTVDPEPVELVQHGFRQHVDGSAGTANTQIRLMPGRYAVRAKCGGWSGATEFDVREVGGGPVQITLK